MHIFQASLIPNLANATIIPVCVLGIGFMLRFLHALTKELKTALVAQSSTRPNRRGREYDRDELFSGAPQALKEAALTREYRFTGSSWQEPNRA